MNKIMQPITSDNLIGAIITRKKKGIRPEVKIQIQHMRGEYKVTTIFHGEDSRIELINLSNGNKTYISWDCR